MFNQGFGFPINPENRWVKLSENIPWDALEDIYASKFSSDTGNVAITFRVALGSLIIRRVLKLSDRQTLKTIQESPYLQYFIGLDKFNDKEPPFDHSMMSRFRSRLNLDDMKEIIDLVVAFEKKTAPVVKSENTECEGSYSESVFVNNVSVENSSSQETDDSHFAQSVKSTSNTKMQNAFGAPFSSDVIEENIANIAESANSGTLIIDATCCPVNIRYPQDFSLLNECREKLEAMINRACNNLRTKKPRTYCRIARKKYLAFAKTKRRSKKKTRSIIRFMLNCVKRNKGYLEKLIDQGFILTEDEEDLLKTIQLIYDQQLYMYENDTHRVADRIVSLHMPFIRPIMRGKIPVPTEFGPKIDLAVDENGNKRITYFSYDSYNEATHLIEAIEEYKAREGHYPEAVLADQIYRNKANRKYCEEHGIRMSGPRLGKTESDSGLTKEELKIERQDAIDRSEVERRFSREKRCFGLDKIFEKLEVTVANSVSLAVLLDNLIPVGF